MNGFKQVSGHELKIQVIIRRLEFAIRSRDEVAIGRAIREAQERYGEEILSEAWATLTRDYPWMIDTAVEAMTPEMRHEFHAAGYDLIVGTVIDAGLRIEDHVRVSDNGIALTREAIAAIAATGFPGIAEFGSGNDNLDGIGIGRSPYLHPLAEVDPNNPDFINLWAAASLFVSAAMGWVPDEPPTEQAMRILKDAVNRISPNTDFETLIRRARYDDRMLLKLSSLMHQRLTCPK